MTQTEWGCFETIECGILTVMDFDEPKRWKDTETAVRIRRVKMHLDYLVRQTGMWWWYFCQLVDMRSISLSLPPRNDATTAVPHNIKWYKKKIVHCLYSPWCSLGSSKNWRAVMRQDTKGWTFVFLVNSLYSSDYITILIDFFLCRHNLFSV